MLDYTKLERLARDGEMTFFLTTLGKATFSITTLSINDTEHNNMTALYAECYYAECRV